jgi:hypothetical protein
MEGVFHGGRIGHGTRLRLDPDQFDAGCPKILDGPKIGAIPSIL